MFGTMEWLFGKRKSPQEVLKQNRQALRKAERELNRENNRLGVREQQMVEDIKKSAKAGQMDHVRVMAKALVQTRNQRKKLMAGCTNIQSIGIKLQSLASQDTMAQTMRNVVGVMASMNRQLDLPQIQKIMSDFEHESEIMGMKEEIMNNAIDEVIGEQGEDEETDNIVEQVLDELGIELGGQLGNLPTMNSSLISRETVKTKQLRATAVSDPDADIEARLANLRG